MPEFLDDIFGLGYFFGPSITAFALAAFSPLRQLRQPAKMFAIGIASSAVAAFFSILMMSRGTIGSRAVLLIIGISFVVGALISLLTSSETISEKKQDELVRKSDDQSWRV
jgi:hypothetical protein